MVFGHGVSEWHRAVEVGQGTGKYTRLVLEASSCEVLCCDVSQTFLDLCAQRLQAHASRLHLACIEGRDPDAIRGAADQQGWLGSADAVYSIDALVHLPFTTVANTMLAATEVLREGGRFITSFAHGLTEAGFAKLVGDIDRTMRAGGHPETGCFHWISPELIRTTATRMGYEGDVCDADPAHHRDGHFVARLVDPELAKRARGLRQPNA